jgi:energy-coupling factor transporter ATP-binding protein EcfA2
VPEPILEARGFTYRYPESSAPALRDVTLSLEPGSFTVLAGESGSGKSTLLRAACGLVPHFHGGEAGGELHVGGMSLREHGPTEMASVCGTVFQEPESQVVMGGVRAEIALPLEHRGESPAAVARAVEESALALGIAHLLERRTETLSGGELQRVALAAALAPRPQLLVLDEPTSQLDPVAGDELVWMLRRLNEEWGTAVLLAEHRLERCLAPADRVIALAHGELACDAPPEEFLSWAARSESPLATPGARLFRLAGLAPLPASVKAARARLRDADLLPQRAAAPEPEESGKSRRRRRGSPPPALEARGVWHELRDGPAILAGLDLRVDPGERVALMGRNGAGKSTLLKHLRGLMQPTRGRIDRAGDVALLLQSPGDYLIHDRVGEETAAPGVVAAGLEGREQASPRDISGGERQRLALEVVLGGGRPALVCLDEPTRGMDRAWKASLAERLRALAAGGVATIVATHDTEFAADLATRIVLMGQGVVIADGPPSEILAGGWHFATEVARILGGAEGALTPEQGALVLERELVS